MLDAMHLIVSATTATVLSAVFSFCLARWSGCLRLVAQPRPDRWHENPTPNTGGLAILIACACGYLLFAAPGFGVIAGCAGCISILGLVDDRVQLRPAVKLAGQSVAAALLISSGLTLHLTPWASADFVITALWLVGMTNAFNLIDNMDGLCGGVAAIVAASGAWLATLNDDGPRALTLAVLAGACLGFLIFNHKPARIFMGDCGSLFLGFSLAALAITRPLSATGRSALEFLYPLPAFLYPLFDTVLVSVLRRSAGKPISVGGRDHSSHRLVSTGLTERRAVWVLWACAAVASSCGPLTYRHPGAFVTVAGLLVAGMATFGIFLARLPGFERSRCGAVGEALDSKSHTDTVAERHRASGLAVQRDCNS